MKLSNLDKANELLEKEGGKDELKDDKLKRSGGIARKLGDLPEDQKGGEGLTGERKDEEQERPNRTPIELEVRPVSPAKGALLREVDKKLFSIYSKLDREVPFTASLAIDEARRELINNWSQTLGIKQKDLFAVLIDYLAEKFDERIEEVRVAKKQRIR